MMDIQKMIEEQGVDSVNTLFTQYFAIVMAKAMKYDEIVDAIDTNGCNFEKIKKIVQGGDADGNDT